MNVNWFSPLPPDRSGIAEFTAALAPLLRARANVRFVTESVQRDLPNAFSGAESVDCVSIGDVNRADLNVLNIGNNAAFHDKTWRMSCVSAGVVILHDFRLQHLFGGVFLAKEKDLRGYIKLMRQTYGLDGEVAAGLMASGKVSPETVGEIFPLVEVGLRGAAGVVVHSDEALRVVLARCEVPAIKLNLPYDACAAAVVDDQEHDRRTNTLDIVAFGHIGPNRRIESVLRALALARSGPNVVLHVIGDVWNERLLRARAGELGVADRARFHGHLPDATLDEYLRHADLVVNLRWPTMGEASYAQLRAWSHGAPTLVTRTGWYAELPSDAVIHISPEHEVAEIADVIARLTADRNVFTLIGERGRQQLAQEYKPENYVDALLSFGARLSGSTLPAERTIASRIASEVMRFNEPSADLLLECTERALRRVPVERQL